MAATPGTPGLAWLPEPFRRLGPADVAALAQSLTADQLLEVDPLALLFELWGGPALDGHERPPTPLLVTTSRAVVVAGRSAGLAVFGAQELAAISRAAHHDRATWWDVSCWAARKLARPDWVLTDAEALALHPRQDMAAQLGKDCLPAAVVPIYLLDALLGLRLVDAYTRRAAATGGADSTSASSSTMEF